jgi:hypothetical protein
VAPAQAMVVVEPSVLPAGAGMDVGRRPTASGAGGADVDVDEVG